MTVSHCSSSQNTAVKRRAIRTAPVVRQGRCAVTGPCACVLHRVWVAPTQQLHSHTLRLLLIWHRGGKATLCSPRLHPMCLMHMRNASCGSYIACFAAHVQQACSLTEDMTTAWRSGGLRRLLHLRHLHFKVCSLDASAVKIHICLCLQQRQGLMSKRWPWQALLFCCVAGRPAALHIGAFERRENERIGCTGGAGRRPAFAGRAWLAR